jgi:hypothetical protein
LGRRQVFLDIERQVAGTRYPERVLEAVRSSRVVLVLIVPQWLAAPGLGEWPRLYFPDDMVHRELLQALRAEIPIIPVLLRRATMPLAEQLPPDIHDVRVMDGVTLNDGESWPDDVRRLAAKIAERSGLALRTAAIASEGGDGIYRVGLKSWQWQGTLSAGLEQARQLTWQATTNAVPTQFLPFAQQ